MSIRVAVVAASLILVGVAEAHVEVLPASVAKGANTAFTIRVPTESASPTIEVQVNFPAEVSVYSLEQTSGWKVSTRRTADGRIFGVTYRGGSIPAEAYQDFHVLGVGLSLGSGRWPAVQTSANGKHKAWTGPPERPGQRSEEGPIGPAAETTIVAEGSAVAVGQPTTPSTSSSNAGLWLGLIGIGIAALAALGTGLLWTTRPMRLPEDTPDQ